MGRTPHPCMLSHLVSVWKPQRSPLEVLAQFLSLTAVSLEGSFLGIWLNSITQEGGLNLWH